MTSFKEKLHNRNNQPSGSATSQLLDKIGVPAVVLGLFMILNWINLDLAGSLKISFALILLVLSAAYYFMISSHKLAGATAGVLLVLLLFAAWIAGPSPTGSKIVLFLIIFGGGIGALVAAHGVDKSKQALLKHPLQVLTAPLFLVNDLLIQLGIEKPDTTDKKTK